MWDRQIFWLAVTFPSSQLIRQTHFAIRGRYIMPDYNYYYNLIIERLQKVDYKKIKALYYIIDGFLGNS
jgi:hypothetical protein